MILYSWYAQFKGCCRRNIYGYRYVNILEYFIQILSQTICYLATTTPEFFTNVISTFIMDSDMGVGTIIGSLMFNTLGVAALAGLASRQVDGLIEKH